MAIYKIETFNNNQISQVRWTWSQNRVFCEKSIVECNSVKLYQKGFAVFCYDTKCLFCCKTIQEGVFKAESQRSEKHLAYKVKSDFFQQEVKQSA